jgi:hypothetical protein
MKFKNDIEAQADISVAGAAYINQLGPTGTRAEELQLTGTMLISGSGTASSGLYVGYSGSGTNSVQIGRGRTASGISYLDLQGDTGGINPGFRILRYAGANASTAITHYGTANLTINASNGADTVFTNTDVGIGTTGPKAKLDINGHFCVDSKTHTVTNVFSTCLTVNLTSHTGCHVVITAFGDWGGHSSAAYRGEFFLQNGGNQYNEPGIILRQDDNTSDTSDQIICQIVDPTSTANPKDFQIQIRHTDTTSPASFTAQLTYTVQGKFNSIT